MVYRATIFVKIVCTNKLRIRRFFVAKLRCQARASPLIAESAGHQWPTAVRPWPPRGSRSLPLARLVRPCRALVCLHPPQCSPVTPRAPISLLASSFTLASAHSSRRSAELAVVAIAGPQLTPRHSSATAVASS